MRSPEVPASTVRLPATIAVPSRTKARVTPFTFASGSMMLSVKRPPEIESALAIAFIVASAFTVTAPLPTSIEERSEPSVPTGGPMCASTLAVVSITASARAPAAAIRPIVTGEAVAIAS